MLASFGLFGCNGTPHRADLHALHLVLEGRATAKQRILLFERTTYGALTENGICLVKWYTGNSARARRMGKAQAVRDMIEEVVTTKAEKPRFYFL